MLDDSLTRRKFLKDVGLIGSTVALNSFLSKSSLSNVFQLNQSNSHIYESKNGTPEQNVKKVIDMMGGIQNFIGKDDIVILKPNAQWEYQGMTNTNTMKGFIDLLLNIPHFNGEVIIIENYHYKQYNESGWATSNKNGDYNFNELINYFNNNGYPNVTGYILKDYFIGGRHVNHPSEGDGYVTTNHLYSSGGRTTQITYPIFTSPFSGITIDMKNGAYINGSYIDKPIKFINFSVLNSHGGPGVTSSIKNYLGVVELNYPLGNYYNFHDITDGFSNCFALGGSVGTYLNSIRHATLNIVAAEWTGAWGREPWEYAVKTKTVLASIDPVSLDYYGAKYLMYPITNNPDHNPDNPDGKHRKVLNGCHAEGIGTVNENEMEFHKYDFDNPKTLRMDIDRKIREFKNGDSSQDEVIELIEKYCKNQ